MKMNGKEIVDVLLKFLEDKQVYYSQDMLDFDNIQIDGDFTRSELEKVFDGFLREKCEKLEWLHNKKLEGKNEKN